MPLTLDKEHRLRMFENKVQRIIFGPQSHGITKDELHNLYSTLNCQSALHSADMLLFVCCGGV